MVQTLILDIEGTITTAGGVNGKRSAELKELLSALEGTGSIIILCSGRNLEYIRHFKINWGLAPNSPIIAEDGCIIYDGVKEYITFDLSMYNPGVIKDQLLVPQVISLAEFDQAKQFMITLYPKGFSEGLEFTSEQVDNIFKLVKNNLDNFDITLTHSSCSVDVLPSGMDKLIGLKALEQRFTTFDFTSCMYIGDSINDLRIGQYVQEHGGLFCVPENAIKDLKKIADYVAPHQYDEGVMEILEKFDIK
jgi:HAD superfamily hydrolase (TIGR01484 family)